MDLPGDSPPISIHDSSDLHIEPITAESITGIATDVAYKELLGSLVQSAVGLDSHQLGLLLRTIKLIEVNPVKVQELLQVAWADSTK